MSTTEELSTRNIVLRSFTTPGTYIANGTQPMMNCVVTNGNIIIDIVDTLAKPNQIYTFRVIDPTSTGNTVTVNVPTGHTLYTGGTSMVMSGDGRTNQLAEYIRVWYLLNNTLNTLFDSYGSGSIFIDSGSGLETLAPIDGLALVADSSASLGAIWGVPGGGVGGPAVSIDNALPRFGDTSAASIIASGVLLSDGNSLQNIAKLTTTGDIDAAGYNIDGAIAYQELNGNVVVGNLTMPTTGDNLLIGLNHTSVVNITNCTIIGTYNDTADTASDNVIIGNSNGSSISSVVVGNDSLANVVAATGIVAIGKSVCTAVTSIDPARRIVAVGNNANVTRSLLTDANVLLGHNTLAGTRSVVCGNESGGGTGNRSFLCGYNISGQVSETENNGAIIGSDINVKLYQSAMMIGYGQSTFDNISDGNRSLTAIGANIIGWRRNMMLGYGARTNGEYTDAVLIGHNCNSEGLYQGSAEVVFIGANVQCTEVLSVSNDPCIIGYSATGGDQGLSLGANSRFTTNNGVACGYGAVSEEGYAVACGHSASAIGDKCTALGAGSSNTVAMTTLLGRRTIDDVYIGKDLRVEYAGGNADGIYFETAGGTATALNYHEDSSVSLAFDWGGETTGTLAVDINRTGSVVTLRLPFVVIYSSQSSAIFGNVALPARFRPTAATYFVIPINVSGVTSSGMLQVSAGGVLTIANISGGALVSGTDAGFEATSVSYSV